MPNNDSQQMLYQFISDYVLDLVKGTTVREPERAKRKKRAVFEDSHVKDSYWHKYYFNDYDFIEINKSSPFLSDEHALITFIIDECMLLEAHTNPYRDDIAQGIIDMAVAHFLSQEHKNVIKSVIEIYNAWAKETYEGNKIAHSIGIDFTESAPGAVNIKKYADADFLKILGSAYDSLMVLSAEGNIYDVFTLDRHAADKEYNSNLKAPISFIHLAEWADTDKVALSLTRNGEILIFKKQKLLFAKRRGTWRYFPHEHILQKRLKTPTVGEISRETRLAVYLTALDVSFSRGGACLGIVSGDEPCPSCIPTA